MSLLLLRANAARLCTLPCLLLLLALPACGSDSSATSSEGTSQVGPGNGSIDGTRIGPGATRDSNVPTGETGLCSSPADCPEGMACIAGTCSTACEIDEDCPEALPWCDSRRNRCGACTLNRHCPDGTICIEQRCAPECTDDDQCDDETWCDLDTERCIARECFIDRDCRGGEFCDPRTWTCEILECADDEDCDDGRCAAGRCVGADDCDKRGDARCLDDRELERCGMELRWERVDCSPGACVDNACTEGENACGGTALLPEEPGSACGFCGTVVCDGTDSILCEESPLNACNGCGLLPAEPGSACGTCGEWRCDGSTELTCDDPGENACGACAPLSGTPGESCGTCGTLNCSGDNLECRDPGRNRCGGCAELSTFPGASCPGGDDIHVCSGNDALTCVPDTTSECSNLFQCIQWAERFGIPALRVGCDPEIGCYLRGACSLIGPTADDPFGSQCRSGTFCIANVPFLPIDAACIGCTPGEGQCRSGEVCIDATGFGIGACVDLLNPPI